MFSRYYTAKTNESYQALLINAQKSEVRGLLMTIAVLYQLEHPIYLIKTALFLSIDFIISKGYNLYL